MSITEHKKAILAGNGESVMERFNDEFTPMLDQHIWKAYTAGDVMRLGEVISGYMDTLVFNVAADMDDFQNRLQERRA